MSSVVSTAITTQTDEGNTQAASDLAFDQIIRTHQRRVNRVLYSLTRDAELSDTLTQECFLRAYRNLGSFRGECRIDTWLLRIAVNLARDHHKNRKASFWRRWIGLDEAGAETQLVIAPTPSAERSLIARQEVDAVWKAVDTLSRQQREIFLLRFREEMSLAEIADILGLQVGSVKSHLFRAIGGVRKQMKDSYGIKSSSHE